MKRDSKEEEVMEAGEEKQEKAKEGAEGRREGGNGGGREGEEARFKASHIDWTRRTTAPLPSSCAQ